MRDEPCSQCDDGRSRRIPGKRLARAGEHPGALGESPVRGEREPASGNRVRANGSGVARLLGLDPTTLSGTLPPLARAGWIRAGAGKDRREVRWRLTPAGRRCVARALPAWARAQERLRARLHARHWKMLIEDLALVAAAARLA